MTDLQLLNAKASSVKNLMQQLSSPELGKDADPEMLYKKFLLLQKKFAEFTKISGAGKATPELRKTKLKVIADWLNTNAGLSSADVAIQNLPKKYQNKNVALNPRALQQISYFKHYIKTVIDYMDKLEPRYKAIKNAVGEVLEKGKTLQQHMNKFVLTQEDIPSYDLFAADDEEEITGDLPEVGPSKMITGIQAILNKYRHFSIKVSEKYNEVAILLDELDEVDLGEFLTRSNQRNKLIQQLLNSLVDINKILYQSEIPGKHALREQYYQLITQCAPLLPSHIASNLLGVIKSRKAPGVMQAALQQSLQGVKQYDPAKDTAMRFQSPHVKVYTPKLEVQKPVMEETMEDRVNRTLRHQELADVSQRTGNPISQTEKEKYEKLWNTAQARQNILKLAQYYRTKL